MIYLSQEIETLDNPIGIIIINVFDFYTSGNKRETTSMDCLSKIRNSID